MVWLSIAVTIILVIALVLVLSLVPVKINMDSTRSGGKTTGKLRIHWLMLQLGYAFDEKQTEIHLFSRRIARFTFKEKTQTHQSIRKKEKKQNKTAKTPAKTRKKLPIRNYLNLTEPALRLIYGMFGAFRFNKLDFHITYGMNNPGVTGIITGFLHAVTGLFRIGSNIRFTPNFNGWIMDWNIRGMVIFTPFKLVLPAVFFITNIEVLRFTRRVMGM